MKRSHLSLLTLAGALSLGTMLSSTPVHAQCVNNAGDVNCAADDTDGFFSAGGVNSIIVQSGITVDDTGNAGNGAAGGGGLGIIEIGGGVTLGITNNGTVNDTGAAQDGFNINGTVGGQFLNTGTINSGNIGFLADNVNGGIVNDGTFTSAGKGIDIINDVAGGVVNNGTITVNNPGSVADGIEVRDITSGGFRNTGTITTFATNSLSDGVEFRDVTGDFVNDGTITSTAGNASTADAVETRNITGSFINNGTISSNAGTGLSDAVETDNITGNFINNGTITAVAGTNTAEAVETGSIGGSFINHGFLSGTAGNTGAAGADVDDVAGDFINTGIIIGTAGSNARGIDADSIGGVLTNSGTIIGTTEAIRIAGGDTKLTLLAGSNIQGPIDLGSGANTLNVGKGLSIVNTFVNTGGSNAPVVGSTSGQPFAVSGNRIAVVDPTTLGTEGQTLADLTGGIFSTVQNRVNGLRNNAVSGATKSGPMYFAKDQNSVRQYWVQGFGSYREQEENGSTGHTDQHVAGVVSGMDAVISAKSVAGAFFGGSWGRVENEFESQRTDTDSAYGGVYYTTLLGRTSVNLALTAGWTDNDRTREIANNLATGGIETAQANYDGWFISPEITITRPFWPLGGVRLEKIVTLRYAGQFLDGFEEVGASDAFTAEERDIHLAVGRAALAAPFTRQHEDGSISRITLIGGIEGRKQFGDDDLTGTLLNQRIVFEAGEEDDTIAGFASVTGEHARDGVTLFLSLEGKVEEDDAHQVSAKGGFKVIF